MNDKVFETVIKPNFNSDYYAETTVFESNDNRTVKNMIIDFTSKVIDTDAIKKIIEQKKYKELLVDASRKIDRVKYFQLISNLALDCMEQVSIEESKLENETKALIENNTLKEMQDMHKIRISKQHLKGIRLNKKKMSKHNIEEILTPNTAEQIFDSLTDDAKEVGSALAIKNILDAIEPLINDKAKLWGSFPLLLHRVNSENYIDVNRFFEQMFRDTRLALEEELIEDC